MGRNRFSLSRSSRASLDPIEELPQESVSGHEGEDEATCGDVGAGPDSEVPTQHLAIPQVAETSSVPSVSVPTPPPPTASKRTLRAYKRALRALENTLL